jgi:hypothetical protein
MVARWSRLVFWSKVGACADTAALYPLCSERSKLAGNGTNKQGIRPGKTTRQKNYLNKINTLKS